MKKILGLLFLTLLISSFISSCSFGWNKDNDKKDIIETTVVEEEEENTEQKITKNEALKSKEIKYIEVKDKNKDEILLKLKENLELKTISNAEKKEVIELVSIMMDEWYRIKENKLTFSFNSLKSTNPYEKDYLLENFLNNFEIENVFFNNIEFIIEDNNFSIKKAIINNKEIPINTNIVEIIKKK